MFTAVNYLSLFSPSLMVDDIDNHIGLVVANFVLSWWGLVESYLSMVHIVYRLILL